MKAKQKNFILKKLIPFILREQGRGFGMDEWIYKGEVGQSRWFDGIIHKVPVCGTVCCIGGSVGLLKKLPPSSSNSADFIRRNCKELGITEGQTYGLFYSWDGERAYGGETYGWPPAFADRFAKANTPYRKAQAAVALLKEVVRTNGACLNRGDE